MMKENADFIRGRGESPFIPGFQLMDVALENGITLRAAVGGQGEPLVLLHGHPQNHVTWRKIAPVLARHFTVIMPDIRGYGDSAKPASDDDHRSYCKREMAKDIVLLVARLGFQEGFACMGHDRGARVGHRPAQVKRSIFIDIAPTATMYALTDKTFATRYFWWFFLIQPSPMPEKMIAADPAFFLRKHIDGQLKTSGATEPEVFAEYLRCYQDPNTLRAICEDYRASATIDLEDDEADKHLRITSPLLVLWGEKGTVGQLYDVPATWQEKALDVRGRAMPCGHSPQEECPDVLLSAIMPFLT